MFQGNLMNSIQKLKQGLAVLDQKEVDTDLSTLAIQVKLDALRKEPSPSNLLSYLQNLHLTFLRKGDKDAASRYFDEGRTLALRYKRFRQLAQMSMTQVLFDWPDARLCLPRLHEALESFDLEPDEKELSWRQGKADCLAQLSALYSQENKDGIAIDYLFRWARFKELCLGEEGKKP